MDSAVYPDDGSGICYQHNKWNGRMFNAKYPGSINR